MDIQALIKNAIKPVHLAQGIGFSVGLYALIFLINIVGTGQTLERLEETLASETIPIQRADNIFKDKGKDKRTGHKTKKKARSAHDTPAAHDAHDTHDGTHKDSASHHAQAAHEPAMHVPEGLYEEGLYGPLPIISKTGETVFKTFKKPFTSNGLPRIAIVIADYGLSDTHAQNILDHLPPEVSLILSPYTNTPVQAQQKASKKGHEVWLGLAFENNHTLDPGPKGIMRNAGLRINKDNLSWSLSRTTGYAGVAGYLDFHLERSSSLLKTVFDNIFRRGLAYYEMNPEAGSAVETLAVSNEQPYIRNSYDMNKTSLKTLERTAKEKGYAVGVIGPYPNNLRSISIWAETLDAKDLTLVPLSAVVK